MKKEDRLKIGLAVQGIALLVDDSTLEKIRSRLKEIEKVVAEDVGRWEDDEDGMPPVFMLPVYSGMEPFRECLLSVRFLPELWCHDGGERMRREDAVKDLITLKEYFEEESGAVPMSIEYAISALSAKTTINPEETELKLISADGDLISRQAALEPYQTLDDDDTICIWLLRKNIEQLPSAEPKTAECKIVGKTTLHYECSECGGVFDEWDKFCRHCGRKIKEVI